MKCHACKGKLDKHNMTGVYDNDLKKVVWYHKSGCFINKKNRILDANGNIRDRTWLNRKLEITRTDAKWKADIKSRRTLPNGTVGRFRPDGKRIG